MNKVDKVLKIINHTKTNKNSYNGLNCESGYHSFELDGKPYVGYRDNANRIKAVKGFDFTNKVVLDMGCNMGGVLHAMSNAIKYGVGVDFDPKCINAANVVKDLNNKNNVNFYVFNLDKNDFDLIDGYILEDKVDICMFLAVAMHIKRWREVIEFCHSKSNTLLFESNGRQHQQTAQMEFVKTLYNKVTYLFKDKRRKMYLCEA